MRWIAIMTLAAAASVAHAADWKKIITYDDTTGSIDMEAVQRVDAIRLFTARLDYRPARRLDDGRRFDRIDVAMTVHCINHTLTAAKATIMNGERVIDVQYDSSPPQPIRPDSDNDALYKAVCADQMTPNPIPSERRLMPPSEQESAAQQRRPADSTSSSAASSERPENPGSAAPQAPTSQSIPQSQSSPASSPAPTPPTLPDPPTQP